MKKGLVAMAIALLTLVSSGCCTRNVIVYEETPPPPAKVEVISVKPCPRAVWVPGRYVWRGRHRGWVWIPGYWRK